ncbi:polysaccharide export protein [Pseudomonas stutzeri]|nr:polysaccharide export protein [Stutzerimonas stutzeri]
MIRPLSLAIAAVLSLQGCMFSPGQHMDTSKLIHDDSPESSRVELIPITPKTLAVEEVTRPAGQVPAELLAYRPDDYRIGAGDVLYITVWDHPELTTPSGAQQQIEANGRLVRPDGTLFYPYIGTLEVAGQSIEELRSTIARRLAQFVESPQVDVGVLRFNSQKVILSGAFEKAGEQFITNTQLSLVQAIGKAGIDTAQADLASLTLKRDGREYRLDIDALNYDGATLNQVYLKNGDQLHLAYNDRKKVYVLGEVNAPRALTFKARSLNLADAIGSSGGISQETSNATAVYVIRGAEDLEREKAKVFQLDARSPTAFVLAQRFELQPQDVVYVGPAGITRWNRLISQLLPTATMLNLGVDTVDIFDNYRTRN